MAAAVSSMENGRLIRASTAPRPPSRSGQHQHATATGNSRAGRPLHPRISASSSSRELSFFRLSATSSSPRGGSGGGGGGSIGGVWASIMSLGAAALPASLMPLPAAGGDSGAPLSPETSRHARRHAVAARGGVNASLSPPSSSALSLGVLPAGDGDVEGVGVDGARPPALGVVEASAGGRAGVVENAAVVAGLGETAAVPSPSAAAAGSGSSRKAAPQKVYLDGASSVYTCSVCRAHLATRDHVVSECFHGHGGRAFLFERCVNVTAGHPEHRALMTGMHVVADITCTSCGTELGWKYEEAADKTQKYKEGKFILERCSVTLEGCDGDGRYGSRRSASDRYGSDRFGSSSIIGWGSDNAPYADGGRW